MTRQERARKLVEAGWRIIDGPRLRVASPPDLSWLETGETGSGVSMAKAERLQAVREERQRAIADLRQRNAEEAADPDGWTKSFGEAWKNYAELEEERERGRGAA